MPEGTACCPRVFFVCGGKRTEVEAAISLYIARRDPIYIINIPLFLSQFAKEFTNALIIAMDHSANTKVNGAVTNHQFNRSV